jgi:ABC-type oligopeptide transport system substrate-binding subunit
VGLVVASVLTGPAASENVLRWASATEPLTFDPHAAVHAPTFAETQQVYEPLLTSTPATRWSPLSLSPGS